MGPNNNYEEELYAHNICAKDPYQGPIISFRLLSPNLIIVIFLEYVRFFTRVAFNLSIVVMASSIVTIQTLSGPNFLNLRIRRVSFITGPNICV